MGIYKEQLLKIINRDIDAEIDDLNEIIDILSDDNSITDSDDIPIDIKIMKTKVSTYSNAKSMIQKASLKVNDLDNEKIMTPREKRLMYRLVRIIRFIRRPLFWFKRKK